MSKITWEDLKGNNIAIHTPTENIMKLIINTSITTLNSGDCSYENCDGVKIFYDYKEETCVRFYEDNSWGYARKIFYENEGFEIVEYEDVKHLFENYIDITETEEVKYLAKVKLINGEEGYFMEEWEQGEHWIFPAEDINYADTYTNLTALKEILDMYKEEIEECEIIKQTTTTIRAFEVIK